MVLLLSPPKWRSFTGTLTSHHTGQILLGGHNNLFFPTEVERDPQWIALYLSNLTQTESDCLIFFLPFWAYFLSL